MLVILARTADARIWHEELTTDWTSIHDVTGPFIAVICPSSGFQHNPNHSQVIYQAEANGLRVVSPPGLASVRPGNRLSLESRYSSHRGPEDEEVPWVPYRAAATLPEDAALLHAAWSQATSRCAAYFGLGEDMIPSVLVLSLREKIAVLARLHRSTSLYAFCKDMISELGDAPRRADWLRAERATLTEDLRLLRSQLQWENEPPRQRVRDEPVEAAPPVDRVLGELSELDRHLEMVSDVDAERVDTWRGRLTTLLEDLSYAEVRSFAADISEHVCSSPQRWRWLRLDRKARKVATAVNKAEELEAQASKPSELPKKRESTESHIARLHARLMDVESELAELDANLRLADSVQAAASRLLRTPKVTTGRGRDGLAGWELRILEASDEARLRWTTQRA